MGIRVTLVHYCLPLFLLVSEYSLLLCSKSEYSRSKIMGTITVRKRKDGSTGYTAQIRIVQKGVTVYQESQTFDRKATLRPGSSVSKLKWPSPGPLRKPTGPVSRSRR